ncbi:MAG: carbohydrate kinase family protein [Thiolinea sp.]
MSGTRRGFITGGCWCVDQNKTLPFWPQEDTAVTVSSMVRSGGGSGCNFAIDMRCLDAEMPVATIGLVGDDDDGWFLIREAEKYGVNHQRLQVSNAAPTMFTEAFNSQASGLRTHIVNRGTADLLSPDHFDFSTVQERILHLGLPSLHATMDSPWRGDANGWVTVLRKAKDAGLQTNLELVSTSAAQLRELALPCLPYLDTLVVNDFEIGALADMPVSCDGHTDPQACSTAARKVLEAGNMQVVVVHFVEGAVLVSRDGDTIHQPSVKVPDSEYRGANGAGDAFASGFLYGWHEGRDYQRALQLGHAAAAASLRSEQTNGAVLPVAECLALADEWGWRDN